MTGAVEGLVKAKTMPYRLGAAVIATVVLTLLVSYGISEFNDMRRAAAKSELQDTKAVTTEGIIADAGKAQQDTVKVEIDVSDARSAYTAAEQEATNNEPDTRDWRAQPTRDSLRDAARARRLARERSSGAELRGEADDETAPPAER